MIIGKYDDLKKQVKSSRPGIPCQNRFWYAISLDFIKSILSGLFFGIIMKEDNFQMILEKIKSLKDEPGCYLWKNKAGEIIYAGKALKLQNRVRSYLNPSVSDLKTRLLQAEIHDLDWIVTASETDALILEATLIKKHSPKYNVRLKDDKKYPFICVSTAEPFPMVFITRDTKNPANLYFGPYADALAVRHVLKMIYKIFPIRKRKQKLPLAKPGKPCLNFHMNRCLAPCTGEIKAEDYRDIIEQIIRFLEGRKDFLLQDMKTKMASHSAKLEYEAAARYRDMIADVEEIRKKQTVVSQGSSDEDIIAFARREDEGQVVVMEVRSGRLEGKKTFPLQGMSNSSEEEILESFMRDYYLDSGFLPGYIILPARVKKGLEPFMQYFSQKSGFMPKVRFPSAGEKKSLLSIAAKNAELSLSERLLATKLKDKTRALEELREMLNLENNPAVIECYDISHFQGSEPVASGVMFVDGKPFKSGYRHYNIKGYDSINDPGMMHEVISRRLQRLVNEQKTLPDLIVIDGGITQLTKACEAANAAGLGNLPIISLAKKNEEIYIPGRNVPFKFEINSAPMKLLRHLRDEAHRFGVSHHRKRRNKIALKGILEKIPDIGIKRTKEILKFLQQRDISSVAVDDLCEIPGIGRKLAEKILSARNTL